jgi:hypothetical protein
MPIRAIMHTRFVCIEQQAQSRVDAPAAQRSACSFPIISHTNTIRGSRSCLLLLYHYTCMACCAASGRVCRACRAFSRLSLAMKIAFSMLPCRVCSSSTSALIIHPGQVGQGTAARRHYLHRGEDQERVSFHERPPLVASPILATI